MKLITYLFLFLVVNNLYSQTTDLKQLLDWRETSYKTVDLSLFRFGWKKFNRSTSSTCRNYQYILYKGLEKQQIVTLMYTDDYKLENNILSYNALKDWKYNNLLTDLKSLGYKIFKTNKTKSGTSDYYRLNNNTIIVSVFKRKDEHLREIESYTVYVGTD